MLAGADGSGEGGDAGEDGVDVGYDGGLVGEGVGGGEAEGVVEDGTTLSLVDDLPPGGRTRLSWGR